MSPVKAFSRRRRGPKASLYRAHRSARLGPPGLTVRCELDSNAYAKGIVVSDQEMAGLNITHDAFHGEWNYTIHPVVSQSG